MGQNHIGHHGCSDGKCGLPIVKDVDHVLVHKCRTPQGGDKTIKPPIYTLEVENPPDGETFLPGS